VKLRSKLRKKDWLDCVERFGKEENKVKMNKGNSGRKLQKHCSFSDTSGSENVNNNYLYKQVNQDKDQPLIRVTIADLVTAEGSCLEHNNMTSLTEKE
jgi:hypothetical protein